ncbi:MAG TPA: hypothetical protein VHP14_08705 [Anaerolineales bacterium]|nr:hypothetical protein [Anaerolineales bacterium]
MLGRYLLALLLTILVEGCVAYLLGLRSRQSLLAVLAINVLTQPALNYLLLVLVYLNVNVTFMLIIALEILVVILEWQLLVYIFRAPTRRFLAVSFLGNALSFLVGLLFFWA